MASSDLLDRSISLLGTWSGADKTLMLIAYSSKVAAFLAGKSNCSANATRLDTLAATLGDGRMLFRFWGILPVINGARRALYVKKGPKATAIDSVQTLMLLLFYPLEHAYYLASKRIIPLSPYRAAAAAKWSIRVWAVYLALQFVRFYDDYSRLKADTKHVIEATKEEEPAKAARMAEIKLRRESLQNALVRDIGYAPLALHWSTPGGMLPHDGWVGIFGAVAAYAQLRDIWSRIR